MCLAPLEVRSWLVQEVVEAHGFADDLSPSDLSREGVCREINLAFVGHVESAVKKKSRTEW